MKTVIAALALLTLPSGAFARKEKKEQQNVIVETRNVPLGTTTFTLRRTHEVKRIDGYGYGLRIIPFAVQDLDGGNRRTGIRIRVIPEAWYASTFSRAAVVLMIDGHRNETPAMLDWIVDNAPGAVASEATIAYQANVLRVLMDAKEVYLTVLIPDQPEPKNQISFKLSQEQRNDCRLISEKYDEQQQP